MSTLVVLFASPAFLASLLVAVLVLWASVAWESSSLSTAGFSYALGLIAGVAVNGEYGGAALLGAVAIAWSMRERLGIAAALVSWAAVIGLGVVAGPWRGSAFVLVVGAIGLVYRTVSMNESVALGLMVGLSGLAVFWTVPDTTTAVAILGASIVLLSARGRIGLGTSSALLPAVAALAWIAVEAGRSRPGAVVGGLSAIVFLVVPAALATLSTVVGILEPVGVQSRSARRILVVGHALAVALASRLAGLQDSAVWAMMLSAVALLAYIWAVRAIGPDDGLALFQSEAPM